MLRKNTKPSRSGRKKAFCLVALFILGTLPGIGCSLKITHNLREISVKPQIQAATEKIPARAGVYLTEDFKKFTFPIEQSGFRGTVEVGKSITMPLYGVLSSVFESIVFLETFTPGAPPQNSELQLVLFPQIDHFQWRFKNMGPASRMEAQLTLSCEFFDAAGRPVHKIIESGVRSESTVSMAFSGLNAVESAEKPTRLVFEDVLNGLPSKILADRLKLLGFRK
jgi:hypothetical protein